MSPAGGLTRIPCMERTTCVLATILSSETCFLTFVWLEVARVSNILGFRYIGKGPRSR